MRSMEEIRNFGKLILKSVSVILLLGAVQAEALDCYTDCGAVASFRYRCPTFSNPGRKCTGRDPGTYAACETTKAAACRVLRPVANSIIRQMVARTSRNSAVIDAAKGWTTLTCASAGLGIITAVNAGYSVPVCAALNVAAAGCGAFILASGGVITGGVCSQLCTDRHLSDCR